MSTKKNLDCRESKGGNEMREYSRAYSVDITHWRNRMSDHKITNLETQKITALIKKTYDVVTPEGAPSLAVLLIPSKGLSKFSGLKPADDHGGYIDRVSGEYVLTFLIDITRKYNNVYELALDLIKGSIAAYAEATGESIFRGNRMGKGRINASGAKLLKKSGMVEVGDKFDKWTSGGLSLTDKGKAWADATTNGWLPRYYRQNGESKGDKTKYIDLECSGGCGLKVRVASGVYDAQLEKVEGTHVLNCIACDSAMLADIEETIEDIVEQIVNAPFHEDAVQSNGNKNGVRPINVGAV
jgi:hypothetical protein